MNVTVDKFLIWSSCTFYIQALPAIESDKVVSKQNACAIKWKGPYFTETILKFTDFIL